MTAIKKAFMLPERNRNDFLPPPYALWATVPSDDLPGGVQSKPGTREGGDGEGPGSLLHPLPRGRLSECFLPGSGCVGGCGRWGGAGAGDFKYGTKTFPDYQASVSLRRRLATSSASWLEVTLVSLSKDQASGRFLCEGYFVEQNSIQQTFPKHPLGARTSGRQ